MSQGNTLGQDWEEKSNTGGVYYLRIEGDRHRAVDSDICEQAADLAKLLKRAIVIAAKADVLEPSAGSLRGLERLTARQKRARNV